MGRGAEGAAADGLRNLRPMLTLCKKLTGCAEMGPAAKMGPLA